MTSASDFTTEEGLSVFLTSASKPHAAITLLTGGTANFVYRVVLPDGATVIYKHAAPYLHSNVNFAFDPARMDYENKALTTVPSLLTRALPVSSVAAVEHFSYDREAKLLCIADGGDRNLKTAYTNPHLDIPTIGEELGTWIAALHRSTSQTSLSLTTTDDLGANNSIAVAIYRHSYNNLCNALKDFGYDVNLAERVNDEFGSQLATDNECVCHGDFWPGNVLVKFEDISDRKANLTVVDWEMTRRGISATDVGQFAAEAFLLDRFKGERLLLPAFLDAYVAARHEDSSKLSKEWARRVIVHWAVHVAFWPTRVEWTDREGTRTLVEIGVNALIAAMDEDWEALKASELLRNASDSFKQLIDV